MKFGLALAVQHRPEDSLVARFQEHVAQVRLAREVGFDSIWASQHLLAAPFTYLQPIPVRPGERDSRHRSPQAGLRRELPLVAGSATRSTISARV